VSLGFLSSKVPEELGGREKRRDCQWGERGKDLMEAIFRQPSARSREMGFGEVPRVWKEKR